MGKDAEMGQVGVYAGMGYAPLDVWGMCGYHWHPGHPPAWAGPAWRRVGVQLVTPGPVGTPVH